MLLPRRCLCTSDTIYTFFFLLQLFPSTFHDRASTFPARPLICYPKLLLVHIHNLFFHPDRSLSVLLAEHSLLLASFSIDTPSDLDHASIRC